MLLAIVAFGVKVNSGKGPREQNRTIIHEIEARVQSMDNLEELARRTFATQPQQLAGLPVGHALGVDSGINDSEGGSRL